METDTKTYMMENEMRQTLPKSKIGSNHRGTAKNSMKSKIIEVSSKTPRKTLLNTNKDIENKHQRTASGWELKMMLSKWQSLQGKSNTFKNPKRSIFSDYYKRSDNPDEIVKEVAPAGESTPELKSSSSVSYDTRYLTISQPNNNDKPEDPSSSSKNIYMSTKRLSLLLDKRVLIDEENKQTDLSSKFISRPLSTESKQFSKTQKLSNLSSKYVNSHSKMKKKLKSKYSEESSLTKLNTLWKLTQDKSCPISKKYTPDSNEEDSGVYNVENLKDKWNLQSTPEKGSSKTKPPTYVNKNDAKQKSDSAKRFRPSAARKLYQSNTVFLNTKDSQLTKSNKHQIQGIHALGKRMSTHTTSTPK